MLEVVAYKRLKTIENDKTISPQKGPGRIQEVQVVCLRFQL